MYQNDINFHFKTADVVYFCDIPARSFHGRQNLLWGGDKEVKRQKSTKISQLLWKIRPWRTNIFS